MVGMFNITCNGAHWCAPLSLLYVHGVGTLTAAHSVGDLVFRDAFLFDVNSNLELQYEFKHHALLHQYSRMSIIQTRNSNSNSATSAANTAAEHATGNVCNCLGWISRIKPEVQTGCCTASALAVYQGSASTRSQHAVPSSVIGTTLVPM